MYAAKFGIERALHTEEYASCAHYQYSCMWHEILSLELSALMQAPLGGAVLVFPLVKEKAYLGTSTTA